MGRGEESRYSRKGGRPQGSVYARNRDVKGQEQESGRREPGEGWGWGGAGTGRRPGVPEGDAETGVT